MKQGGEGRGEGERRVRAIGPSAVGAGAGRCGVRFGLHYGGGGVRDYSVRLTAIIFLSRDNSLALTQRVNAGKGPPIIYIYR